MSNNRFVFVVCGDRVHIDTLHFSLRYLKHFSKTEIIVVTDSLRNAISVRHDIVVDVKTPLHFNNHQASIYLKTGLNKFLPKGFTYCYLDTDVVALSSNCDDVFNHKQGVVTFGADHCRMPKFSLNAVKCDCVERNNQRIAELEVLKEKYDPTRKWRDPVVEGKKKLLQQKFDTIKINKLNYFFISVRFMATVNKFKLDDDNYYYRRTKSWHDKDGNVIIPFRESMVKDIQDNSDWRWNEEKQRWITGEGVDIYNLTCPHLGQYIYTRFGIEVKDKDFQHWNGGVFLFDDTSEAFMNAWFDKTMQIFEWPEWKVRDQGTLIATAWQFGMQNNPLLPKSFNFLSDWNNLDMIMDDAGNFTDDGFRTVVRPALIHIWHNFGRKGWDVWDYVSTVLPGDNSALEKSLDTEHAVRMTDNNIINGLWIGDELSVIELLTVNSFIRRGHAFHLWTYGPLKNNFPPQVIIRDANEIMPESSVFRYKHANQYGHGKGSVSGFSDIFRYKLLYEKGGWWVDMDVTCLQPFDIKDPYFFRSHHELNIVGNVMKCPPKSELMRLCFEEAVKTVDSENTDWHKPIVILNKYVKQLGLQSYVHSGCGNPDIWSVVEEYIYGDTEPRENYLFIHWMNEEWRTKKIDKAGIPHRSILGRLLLQYKLTEAPTGKWKLFKSNTTFLLNVFRLQVTYFFSKQQKAK